MKKNLGGFLARVRLAIALGLDPLKIDSFDQVDERSDSSRGIISYDSYEKLNKINLEHLSGIYEKNFIKGPFKSDLAQYGTGFGRGHFDQSRVYESGTSRDGDNFQSSDPFQKRYDLEAQPAAWKDHGEIIPFSKKKNCLRRDQLGASHGTVRSLSDDPNYSIISRPSALEELCQCKGFEVAYDPYAGPLSEIPSHHLQSGIPKNKPFDEAAYIALCKKLGVDPYLRSFKKMSDHQLVVDGLPSEVEFRKYVHEENFPVRGVGRSIDALAGETFFIEITKEPERDYSIIPPKIDDRLPPKINNSYSVPDYRGQIIPKIFNDKLNPDSLISNAGFVDPELVRYCKALCAMERRQVAEDMKAETGYVVGISSRLVDGVNNVPSYRLYEPRFRDFPATLGAGYLKRLGEVDEVESFAKVLGSAWLLYALPEKA